MSSFRKKKHSKNQTQTQTQTKLHRQGKTLGGLQIYTAVLLFLFSTPA
jgi:hypothetical protein